MATAHPLAQQLWSLLRDRPEADRQLVYDALQRRLEVGRTTVRQEQALHAIKKWMELNKSAKAPSRRQYDSFRSAQARLRDWPSVTLIRNAFGSWNTMTAVVEGRPEANVLVRRKTSKGKKLEPELIKEGLRAWIKTIPVGRPLFQKQFLAWCRAESINPDSQFERLPLTAHSMDSVFGGWREALLSVGALDRHYEPSQRLLTDGPAAKRIKSELDLSGVPQASGGGTFSFKELKAWMLWAQDQTKVTTPISGEAYGEIRRRALQITRQAGEVLRIPSPATISIRFGSWAAALKAAELVPADAIGPHDRRPYDETVLLEVIREAVAATSTALTEPSYDKWRTEELKQRRQTDPSARIPSLLALKNRFGGLNYDWQAVLKRADEKERT